MNVNANCHLSAAKSDLKPTKNTELTSKKKINKKRVKQKADKARPKPNYGLL